MRISSSEQDVTLLPTAQQAREVARQRIKWRREHEQDKRRRREERYRQRVEAQKEWLTTTEAGRRKLEKLARELTTVAEDEYVKVTGSRVYTDALRELLRDKGYGCIRFRERWRLRWTLEVEVWE